MFHTQGAATPCSVPSAATGTHGSSDSPTQDPKAPTTSRPPQHGGFLPPPLPRWRAGVQAGPRLFQPIGEGSAWAGSQWRRGAGGLVWRAAAGRRHDGGHGRERAEVATGWVRAGAALALGGEGWGRPLCPTARLSSGLVLQAALS